MTMKNPANALTPPIVAPTADVWRAMSRDERDRFLIQVNDALSDPRSAMSEGRPHKKAKTRVLDLLGRHFGAIGRTIYLAEEMAVHYPGADIFTPDVLAVLDVPQPDEDERLAWVVEDEGKGLDLALEVLHRGDRRKDLIDNVERYAQLGIPEYFVYDRGQQQIHGFRLPTPGARRYTRIVPQAGRFASGVLGLDLAVVGGRLRFYFGESELGGTAALVDRLQSMVNDLSARADQTEQALGALRGSVLRILESRGIDCPEEVRLQIDGCLDPTLLQRWILRATTVQTAAEILADK